MLTIYSPVQCTHQPAYVIRNAERSASFEIPERIDSILSVIIEEKLGSVIAPDESGLKPIHAVHKNGLCEFLMTAYELQTSMKEVLFLCSRHTFHLQDNATAQIALRG